MKVLILGASGRVGNRLATEMLNRGHEVTAFVYGPNHFKKHHSLNVIRGDVHKREDLAAAIKKQEVILSALGSWGTKSHDILTSAMKNLVPLMEECGIKRIVSLTGADARDVSDTPKTINNLSHRILRLIAKEVLDDGEQHIKILRASSLDWTVLRSPFMTNGRNARYKLVHTVPMPWQSISRRCIVHAMADLAENKLYAKRTPFIISA
jgi:putative NADH-flavin reductase